MFLIETMTLRAKCPHCQTRDALAATVAVEEPEAAIGDGPGSAPYYSLHEWPMCSRGCQLSQHERDVATLVILGLARVAVVRDYGDTRGVRDWPMR